MCPAGVQLVNETPLQSIQRDFVSYANPELKKTKLQSIVDVDEIDAPSVDVLDCSDIVRLLQYACSRKDVHSNTYILKATKMLVDFTRQQENLINTLQRENQALVRAHQLQQENTEMQVEVSFHALHNYTAYEF